MLITISKRMLPALLAVAVVIGLLLPTAAFAYVPYDTNYKDGYGRLVWLQPAYNPAGVLGNAILVPDSKDPSKRVPSPLAQPKDLFVTSNDEIYVADTGNSRIVHFEAKGQLKRIITASPEKLNRPEGVFVTPDGEIFIADTGNKRIIKLDKEGKVVKSYGRPDSKFLPQAYKFDPIKVIVDKRGYMYIASLGGYQGLLQLDPEGKFVGFFGANKTPFSVMDSIKRLIYPREMYLKEISKLPGAISNVTTDNDGFIYTITKELQSLQLKKMNIAGKDLFSTTSDSITGSGVAVEKTFGEFRFSTGLVKPQLSDATVDRNGNITAIDTSLKYISQYDPFGNLLFFWAGGGARTTSQMGFVKSPSAIASNSRNDLLILDDQSNLIQVLRPSEFGSLVHQANALTVQGKYEESAKYWNEVLRLNSYYTPAYKGLAKAAYHKGEYEKAREYFLEAGDQQGYSDAFWKIRFNWFQQNFTLLMNIVIAVLAILVIFRRIVKKTAWWKQFRNQNKQQANLWGQLKHSFYMIKHPIDGFSAIRYESKGGFASSLLILTAAFVTYCVIRQYTAFPFNTGIILEQNKLNMIGQFAAVWGGWVISNYLISNISRGEGRFRDIFYGASYALIPLILVGLPLTLLSNFMTLGEGTIFLYLKYAMYVWIALMFFWKVQAIHNYHVGETISNILLTLITMLLVALLLFVAFGLSSELIDFIHSIYQEVSIR